MTYGIFEHVMTTLGLVPRAQQVQLVEMARTATPGSPRFAQAGTGTGKSYVVLSMAVEKSRETGKPSVVVCPTNALVDQYVKKDAPQISRVTGATFTHLKGRTHYLCSNSRSMLTQYRDTAEHEYLARLEEHGTAELAAMGLDPYEWGCPGSKSCSGGLCGALAAREAAAGFDVIITNAHVLVWDERVMMFTGGMARLLPDYGALLVDECHELEATGRACVSDEIGPASRVYDMVSGFREWVRVATRDLEEEKLLVPDDAIKQMQLQAERDLSFLQSQIGDAIEEGGAGDILTSLREDANALERFLNLFEPEDETGARFISVLTPDRTIRRPCVDASRLLGKILVRQPSVLVSGTVPGTLVRRMGVSGEVKDVGHPFDYSKSTLAISKFSPKKPIDRAHRIEQLVRSIVETGGGTLVLFTSWADLNDIMGQVNQRLQAHRKSPDDLPVYLQSQGDALDTQEMIREFREHGNAVLAGVRTLFTGLDIPGPALRQVVLWKMPYPVPTLESQAIEAVHGRQVYWDEMLVTLVQGIGRLIRTTDDVGRVVILDARAMNQRWRASGLTRHLDEFGVPNKLASANR